MYRFPYFIRNQWFKDIFIRSKERQGVNEIPPPFFMRNNRIKNVMVWIKHLIFLQ